ncbi:hypothetical protein LIER_04545 [Lithospermum erythrorhizon]|uniref:Uncharacterized protein n=1 Tax=Lithospermum erythrorhizon TaxID=34254 RepID=A0AAV3NXA4_LITER
MKWRRPIVFKKVKVIQKIASSANPPLTTVPQDSSPHTIETGSLSSKRPAVCEGSHSLGKKAKTSHEAVERPTFPEILNLAEEGVVLMASPFQSFPPEASTYPITSDTQETTRMDSIPNDYSPNLLAPPYTLPGGQVLDGKTTFKSNLESFHAMKPLVLERVCNEFDRAPDPLEVCGAMYKHLIRAANLGYVLVRRADLLDDEERTGP